MWLYNQGAVDILYSVRFTEVSGLSSFKNFWNFCGDIAYCLVGYFILSHPVHIILKLSVVFIIRTRTWLIMFNFTASPRFDENVPIYIYTTFIPFTHTMSGNQGNNEDVWEAYLSLLNAIICNFLKVLCRPATYVKPYFCRVQHSRRLIRLSLTIRIRRFENIWQTNLKRETLGQQLL